jgi:hypothetical protein
MNSVQITHELEHLFQVLEARRISAHHKSKIYTPRNTCSAHKPDLLDRLMPGLYIAPGGTMLPYSLIRFP